MPARAAAIFSLDDNEGGPGATSTGGAVGGGVGRDVGAAVEADRAAASFSFIDSGRPVDAGSAPAGGGPIVVAGGTVGVAIGASGVEPRAAASFSARPSGRVPAAGAGVAGGTAFPRAAASFSARDSGRSASVSDGAGTMMAGSTTGTGATGTGPMVFGGATVGVNGGTVEPPPDRAAASFSFIESGRVVG